LVSDQLGDLLSIYQFDCSVYVFQMNGGQFK